MKNIGKSRNFKARRGNPLGLLLGVLMRNSIISTLAGLTLMTAALPVSLAEDASPVELKDNPPERHVVVKGDTLWGISKRFLKNPWRWPDVWGMNKEQVRNPHLIYPGNVIVLDRSGGSPRLRLEGDGPGGLAEAGKGSNVGSTVKLRPRIRPQQLTTAAISSIPASVIDPFVGRPLIVSEQQIEDAPRVVATAESRVLAGAGDVVYAKGLATDAAPIWQAYRPSKALFDPITNENLGFEVIYLGDLQLQEVGEVSSVRIVRSQQEIGVGDRLINAPPSETLAYVPHSVDNKTLGLVISAPETTISEIGQQQVVVLNLGARNGIEPGHVMALFRQGQVVSPRRLPSSTSNDRDRREVRSVYSEFHKKSMDESVVTPQERYGLVFVFRVFEKVSYGLVMNTTRPVNLFDIVRAP